MFTLVRLGLWGGSITTSEPLPGPSEWESAIGEAKRQGVLGLLCEGVRQLPPEQMPPADLRIRLLLECDALEHRAEHVGSTAEALLARFRAAGLSPTIQKGPSVAKYYAKPLIRKSGDIDIYFPKGDFEKAADLISELSPANEPLHEPDGGICYIWNNVTIEHHNHFFDTKVQFEGLDIDSPEAVVLLQISHILKHALGPGIGLKQLCDYAVVTRKLLPECNIQALAECVRRARLRRWLGRLDSFINTYLGIPEGELLSTKIGIGRHSHNSLLKIILQGGEFGHHNPFRTLMTSPGRRKINTLRFFIQRLPFALSTAPAEWWHTFSALVKGNLTH